VVREILEGETWTIGKALTIDSAGCVSKTVTRDCAAVLDQAGYQWQMVFISSEASLLNAEPQRPKPFIGRVDHGHDLIRDENYIIERNSVKAIVAKPYVA
jgi:hypothetical protein